MSLTVVPGRVSSYLAARPVVVAVLCGLLAVLAGASAAYYARLPGDDGLTSLVHLSTSDQLGPYALRADPSFRLVPPGAHYDGTYYYAIATDPLATGTAHRYIDLAAYRYGHAFYGQLAWAVSMGHADNVPKALFTISMVAMFVAAYAASRLAVGHGWSPWCGLVIALSPGLVYAASADCSENVSAALLALSLLAWHRRRFLGAGVALVCLALSKEPLSLVPVGILAYEAVRMWRRHGRLLPPNWRRHRRTFAGAAAALAAGPLCLILWLLYLRHQFGVWPLGQNSDVRAIPLAGVRDTLDLSRQRTAGAFEIGQVAAAIIPEVVVLFLALAVGLVRAVRLRTVFDGVYLLTAPLLFLLSIPNLSFPKEILRMSVIPLLLLPAVLFGRTIPGRTARGDLRGGDRSTLDSAACSAVSASPSSSSG